MKGAMGWAKTHWAIVLFVVILLAAPPAMIYVSTDMSAKQRDTYRQAVMSDQQALGRWRERYEVPGMDGQNAFSYDGTVNDAITSHFDSIGKAYLAEVEQVAEAGRQFNQQGHGPLVARLFPRPSEEGLVLQRAMARTYLGMDGAHAALLNAIGAGSPPDAGAVLDGLTQVRDRKVLDIQTRTGRDKLTEEEAEALRTELAENRVFLYEKRSGELSVYADPSVFAGVGSAVPSADALTLTWLWDRQERFWIHQDLTRAIGAANAGTDGVKGAVVKRILSVVVDDTSLGFGGAAPMDPGMDPLGAPAAAAGPTPDFSRSLTGRSGGNSVYDVRNASLRVIVDSVRMPELFDAISKTNFMTVVDCDLRRFDPAEHLLEGFVYADDDQQLVIAELRIETIWLREWTKELMPPAVRQARGIADAQQASGAQ